MIRCYTGGLGAGKTLSMVEDALTAYRAAGGLHVYTNMAGLRCPESTYFDHIEEICHVREGLILLDEALVVLPARFFQEVGRDLIETLMQLRKNGLDLYYTSQRSGGVNNELRNVTNEIIKCERHGRYIWRFRIDPEEKIVKGRTIRKIDPKVTALYDTFQRISRHGGTAREIAKRERLSIVEQKRESLLRDYESRPAARPPCLLEWDWQHKIIFAVAAALQWSHGDIRAAGLSGPQMSADARAALDYLRTLGPVDLSRWQPLIRAEIKRQRWLAYWGLAPNMAHPWCNSRNPWLDGDDPESVREHRAERELREAEEELDRKSMEAARTLKAKKNAVAFLEAV